MKGAEKLRFAAGKRAKNLRFYALKLPIKGKVRKTVGLLLGKVRKTLGLLLGKVRKPVGLLLGKVRKTVGFMLYLLFYFIY